MRAQLSFILSLVVAITMAAGAGARAENIRVEVYAAKESNVNSFLISDSLGSIIIDATRSSREAQEVAKLAKAHGGDPKTIFITHGHPDHYLGLSALSKEFPRARILVASDEVKEDIIGFTKFMEKNIWLETEPEMKAKSEKHPNGFDYQNLIQVSKGKKLELPGGESLDILNNFPATEAAHETLLYSKDLNALFASDLVYNGVHLWMGSGVDAQAIENWKSELRKLREKYAPLKSIIYPGHGKPSDESIFDTDIKYMDNLMKIAKSANTQAEAKAEMLEKYPGWQNTDFLLKMSLKNQFTLLKK